MLAEDDPRTCVYCGDNAHPRTRHGAGSGERVAVVLCVDADACEARFRQRGLPVEPSTERKDPAHA